MTDQLRNNNNTKYIKIPSWLVNTIIIFLFTVSWYVVLQNAAAVREAERRITKLEARWDAIDKDIEEMKTDVKDIKLLVQAQMTKK